MSMRAGVDVFDEMDGGPPRQPHGVEDPLSLNTLYERTLASTGEDPKLDRFIKLAFLARLEKLVLTMTRAGI